MASVNLLISQASQIILTWVDLRVTLRNSVLSFLTSEGCVRTEQIKHPSHVECF